MERNMNPIKEEFIFNLHHASLFYPLFDQLDNVFFFVKDINGVYRLVNQALVERCGCCSEDDMIGKTDYEFFPTRIVEKWIQDDRHILDTGKPLTHIVELFTGRDGTPQWHITHKYPVFSHHDKGVGIMGTVMEFDIDSSLNLFDERIIHAITYIKENFTRKISIKDIAEENNLSVRQLEQLFHDQLRISPREMITNMRVHKACEGILRKEETLATISIDCGFYDQSDLTRKFKIHMGMSPTEYRQSYFQKKKFDQ